MQRLSGVAEEGRGVDHLSSANSGSEDGGDDNDDSRQQPNKKQRDASPVFDVVAFLDRLSTR